MLKDFLKTKTVFFVLLTLYIISNIIILTLFPFVHSDETWLSGLSRNILETGNYAVTEPFFDLYPRNPHAIKSIFHTIQMLFIEILGYKIFSIRLLSFLFGLLTLFWFYKLSNRIFCSQKIAFISTFLLAIDIQFIYASHFARQEIILLFILLFTIYHFLSNLSNPKLIHHLFLGIIIGLSIGIHPNSFIISLSLVILYLFHIFVTRKQKTSGLLIYIGTVACFALGFVVLSFIFDSNFVENYLRYGTQFSVNNTFAQKISEIQYFYLKLYYGISGTYYTPNIKLVFFLFALAFLTSLFLLTREKRMSLREMLISIVLVIIALNAGIIIIGRFNQTSIIFLVPLFYLLVSYILTFMSKKPRFFLTATLIILLSFNSIINILPYLNNSYDRYLQEIGKFVKSYNTVLANLNSEMYFDNGKLYDFRNLAHLKENNLTFEQYIARNEIEYIIYPDEMDFIYAYRPRLNNVYGDISLYYDDMQRFLQTKCELVYEFSEPTYGMRISSYINKREWKIRIYKVNQ